MVCVSPEVKWTPTTSPTGDKADTPKRLTFKTSLCMNMCYGASLC